MEGEQNNNGTEKEMGTNKEKGRTCSPIIGTFTGDEIIASCHPKDKKITVKRYDFKRPDKFSRDQIRTLAIIHETYARLASTRLITMLRCDCSVSMNIVDQMTFEEYVRELPPITTMAVINMDPLKGSAIMQIDNTLTFSIIERLAGRSKIEKPGYNRDMTHIEQALMEGIFTSQLNGPLHESWSMVLDLRPRLGQIETNPQFGQIVPPTEMVVVVELLCRIQSVENKVTFCYPFLTIEPVMPKLTAQYWYSSVRRKPPDPDMFLVSQLKADTTIYYKGEEITLNGLHSLCPGNLIKIPGYKKGEGYLACGKEELLKLKADKGKGPPGCFTIIDEIPPGTSKGEGLLIETATETKNTKTDQVTDTLSKLFQSIEKTLMEKYSHIEKRLKEVALKQTELSDQLYFGTKEGELDDQGEPAREVPFQFLHAYGCDQIFTFIRQEHPQVIALILAYLEPNYSSQIIGMFPRVLQGDIMERIAFMDRTAPQVLKEIERVLQKKFSQSHDFTPAGGIDSVVEILNLAGGGVEEAILDSLEKRDKHLAQVIRKKMFLFEYMNLLDPAVIILICEKADRKDIVLSLKGTTPEVREHILNSLADKEKDLLNKQLMAAGPVRQQDIETAQQRLIAIVRELEEEGKIVIARTGEVIE